VENDDRWLRKLGECADSDVEAGALGICASTNLTSRV